DVITQAAHPDANIIFGAVIDDSLGDEVKVTVIAAGFDKTEPLEQQGQFLHQAAEPAPGSLGLMDDEDDDEDEVFRADPPRGAGSGRVVVDATDEGDDGLDVPSFLR